MEAIDEMHEKNYKLAKEAVEKIVDENIELHTVYNVPHEKLIYYYNAGDVLLLSSLWRVLTMLSRKQWPVIAQLYQPM